MTTNRQHSAILRMHCPDKQGIVSEVTNYIYKNSGNIVSLDQYVDHSEGHFFMRVEWDLSNFTISETELPQHFEDAIAKPFNAKWKLDFSDKKPKMALFVSRASHCLYDILGRVQGGEWNVEIPIIVSNHKSLQQVAHQFGINFYHFSMEGRTKEEVEQEELELLEKHDIDFVVLARYMQILSSDFINHYPEKIINIHHSFLPAFAGAKPYHAAHARGVKIIGATGHYVTSDLDAGPIIEQDIDRISHHDSVHSLIEKGKDVEKIVLARAIKAHIEMRTLVYKNRTIIFN